MDTPSAQRSAPRPARRSPFAGVVPAVLALLAFTAATLVWIVAGDQLPGGRWMAVHLVTLGVLSNAILAFSRHFSDTLTKVADFGNDAWITPVFNLGVVAVMVGMATGRSLVVGLGATTATAAVLGSWLLIRRARRTALGARFAWIVRSYQRAHGAFVHGAILGALMGTGALAGTWYAAGRIAHLHVNLLGWAGITLLATIVFFGPTMARTRIAPGADDRAAKMIRVGAHAVTVASLALLATGVGGGVGTTARLVAAVALGVFAGTATSTCRAVIAAMKSAKPGAARRPVAAVCRWLPWLAWLDAMVVATASWRHLDALGVTVLLGVFVQAVAVTLTYLAPMLTADRNDGRERLRVALDRFARTRAMMFNLGVVAIGVMAAVGPPAGFAGAVVARVGWTMVAAALVQPLATVVLHRRRAIT